MTTSLIATAFLMGLLGSGHCLAMCGGVSSSLTLAVKERTRVPLYTVLYNLGRLVSYGIAGALTAGISQELASRSGIFNQVMAVLSGVFMILVALYIMRFTVSLTWLEFIGKKAIWQHLVKFNKYFMPVNSAPKAFGYGALWGWLPCGLVYSALMWAITTKNAFDGALFMAFFALGTMPAMLGLAFAADKFKLAINQLAVRLVLGNLLLFYGLYLLIIALL